MSTFDKNQYWPVSIQTAYRRLRDADSQRVVELIAQLESNSDDSRAHEELARIQEKEKHFTVMVEEIEWQTGTTILDPVSRKVHEEVEV